MQKEQIQEDRLKKVLQKAKQDTRAKDMATFAFAGFFTTLLALLAPFFTKKS